MYSKVCPTKLDFAWSYAEVGLENDLRQTIILNSGEQPPSLTRVRWLVDQHGMHGHNILTNDGGDIRNNGG